MKRLCTLLAFGLFLGCSSGKGTPRVQSSAKEKLPEDEVLLVPTLGGNPVFIPVSEAHKIKPLGWAMMLENDAGTEREAFSLAAYKEQCRRNPGLDQEVMHIQDVKAMIDSRTKHRRRLHGW